MRTFKTSDFDYDLPEELIAKYPAAERSGSRLFKVDVPTEMTEHASFKGLIEVLTPNDLLVFNNTKVIPARLIGRKVTGARVECLIERILSPQRATAHLKANKSVKIGLEIIFHPEVTAVVNSRQDDIFELEFISKYSLIEILNQFGQIPLPPYIDRPVESLDSERYQTVYAQKIGAIAAPTAGLHFDTFILQELDRIGVRKTFVTLHVGAGTFQPLRVESLEQHRMHSEYMEVLPEVCAAIQHCKANGGRVIAVGTTAVRCLETAARGGEIKPYCGDTNIFIHPGFEFHCVDALITNFHLPKSTLLMLVAAFGGYDLMMKAYREAVAQKYRFFSYGDAMWINSKK